MLQNLNITFINLIQVAAMFSAYQLGRMQATDKKAWPRGNFWEGGWEAWRIAYFVTIGLALALSILYPMLRSTGLLGRGMYGGGGGMYGAGGGMYGAGMF